MLDERLLLPGLLACGMLNVREVVLLSAAPQLVCISPGAGSAGSLRLMFKATLFRRRSIEFIGSSLGDPLLDG